MEINSMMEIKIMQVWIHINIILLLSIASYAVYLLIILNLYFIDSISFDLVFNDCMTSIPMYFV